MRVREQKVCLYTAEGRKRINRARSVSESILALFVVAGVLASFQDMMYSLSCLAGAAVTGGLVILLLQISEGSARASGLVRLGIYALGVICFLGTILYLAQGFLYTVNQFLVLWNLRFGTEFLQFSVNSAAAPGSMIFWCLLAVPAAFLVLTLIKGRKTGLVLGIVCLALLVGFVIGRSRMWTAVLCLIPGTLGMLIFSASPGRRSGIRGAGCILLAGLLSAGCILATGGYEGLSQITRWRAQTVARFESFRYGEDTLPKGDLVRAPGLLDGEEETLELEMEEIQEWYLKGFVGGSYDGSSWQTVPAEAYQGEYEGLMKWLETKDFSAVTQYSSYHRLTGAAEGTDTENTRVQVHNLGAYRKYAYLPSSVESWTGGARPKKDWQVCSNRFFGAKEYGFEAAKGAVTADSAAAASWVQDPAGADAEAYLDAESIYHSFAEDYYTEVDAELGTVIEEMFFPEDEERDFNDVTARIRKVLRTETRYTEAPENLPAGEDFVRWFLEDSKRGNAVHYASAAVMAYRTAGYPARYVEGYHYPGEEEDAAEEGTTAVLTGKNAHAWAEVYVAGIGWLPVEVVPGMYTELYTNQLIEGKPSYQVNANPGEDGLELNGDASEEKEEREQEASPWTVRKTFSVILLILYAGFALYLLLELQRAVRRIFRRRSYQKKASGRNRDQVIIGPYAAYMERLLTFAKVEGNYNHPLELSRQVTEKIPAVSQEEYIRAVNLLQKIQFGGKELLPHERHTLDCFAQRLAEAIYRQENLWGRLKLRYWYIVRCS